MASDRDDHVEGDEGDTLARQMRVTFDTEELHAFFDGFDALAVPSWEAGE